jgi:hypothetical protein
LLTPNHKTTYYIVILHELNIGSRLIGMGQIALIR